MKKNAILLFSLLMGGFSIAQSEQNVEVVQGNYLGLSEELRNLPQSTDEDMVYENDEGEGLHERRKKPEAVDPTALPVKYDPVRQSYQDKSYEIQLGVNVQGMGGSFPPDPTGAVSEDYYVQAVNTAWKVFNKDGTNASGPSGLNTLWPGSTNSGDPIVMYDRQVQRFVITQFQTGSNEILFAVSETADPLGSYHLYEFSFPSFPDYPKYSIWSDGYYMTSNTYTQNVVAFEREKMIAGDPTASMISMNLPNFETHYGFRSVLPADADGDLPPYGTPISLFTFQDDSWSSSVTEDHILIMKMSVDWDNPNSSSIAIDQELPTAAFNSVFTTSWNDIVQKGTSQRLDAISSIFNYRAQYLRWPTHNSVMLCNVVDVDGSNTAGIRWYELRQDVDSLDWEIYQQSTFAPDDGRSRFIGSIAMDYNGHIGLAYSFSGPNDYPGLACTGRLSWDAPGDMSQPETVAQEGLYFQSGGNRYGDYSHMSLDPDGSTFWYTGEYIGNGGARRTKIFSFNLEKQVGVNQELADGESPILNAIQDQSQLTVDIDNFPSTNEMYVELFSLDGRRVAKKVIAAPEGKLSTTFDISSLRNQNAVYIVRAGKDNFMRVKKVAIIK
tara:strand:+ start:47256 stop:49088 length:1833 start_codon:yes stop_codon:yes gene_type:complete